MASRAQRSGCSWCHINLHSHFQWLSPLFGTTAGSDSHNYNNKDPKQFTATSPHRAVILLRRKKGKIITMAVTLTRTSSSHTASQPCYSDCLLFPLRLALYGKMKWLPKKGTIECPEPSEREKQTQTLSHTFIQQNRKFNWYRGNTGSL